MKNKFGSPSALLCLRISIALFFACMSGILTALDVSAFSNVQAGGNRNQSQDRVVQPEQALVKKFFDPIARHLPESLSGYGFRLTGSMNLARASHQATLLANGKVLVTGGDTSAGITNTAELYDPATETWRYTVHPMNVGRTAHEATLLLNGKVLISGGASPSGSLNSAEIFDPVTETFTLTGSMANARHAFRAVRLNDGRVLAVSGRSTVASFVTPTNEIYDPESETWSTAPSLGAGVTNHTATLLQTGQVLIAGGYDGFHPSAYNVVFLYTPSSNSLISMSGLLTARLDHGAALLPDGKVVIVAGSNPSFVVNTTEIYDAAVPPSGQSVAGANLNEARRGFTTTRLGNGDVVVAGGFQSGNGCCFVGVLASAELRSHTTGTWASAGMMSTPRSAHTATLLLDGRVLVAGGDATAGGALLSSAELYDPDTNALLPPPQLVGLGNAAAPGQRPIQPHLHLVGSAFLAPTAMTCLSVNFNPIATTRSYSIHRH